MQEQKPIVALKNWMTVEDYAKEEGISIWGVYKRIGEKLINPKDVMLLPKKTKILIRRKKKT